jgi:hypothetical protein
MQKHRDLNERIRFSAKMRNETIRDIVYSVELAEAILSFPNSKLIKNKEREQLKLALESINNRANDLISTVDELERELLEGWKCDTENDGKDFFGLWGLIFSVFPAVSMIYSIGHLSDYGDRFSEVRRAFDMQKKKKGKQAPQEAALIEAIKVEHGIEAESRPNKEAGAILDAVNQRLELAGLKTVKVDVVRRRLEKWPAPLKSAEKVAN